MRKKVLLINPRKGWRPPLGLLYVASYVRAAGYEVKVVEFIDEVFFPRGNDDLWGEIEHFSPDFIGLGVISWNRRVAGEIIARLKRLLPAAILFCGGKDPTFKPAAYFDFGVDYVVHGEGEQSCVRLLDALNAGEEVLAIKGLYLLSNGELVNTGKSEPVPVTNLLYPAFELVDYDHYCDIRLGGIPGHFVRTGFLMANRGCPFKCRFCTDPIRNIYRERPIEDIIAEIKWQIDNWQIKGLVLLDDLFYFSDSRVSEFCNRILEEGIRLKLYAQTRVDRIGSKETLALMAKAGFIQLALGVESGSQRMLDIMNKGTRLSQIVKAIADINEAGIYTYAFLIIGFPEETENDLQLTEKFLQQVKPTFAAVNYFMPMPGTEYYNAEDEENLLDLSYSLTENQQQFHSPLPKEKIIEYRGRFLAAVQRSADLNLLRYPAFYLWIAKLFLFSPTVIFRGIVQQWHKQTYTSYFDAVRTSMINYRIYRR
ncbi:MAG: B12-binding domain-containing radical SAM protein [Proteobacteria bacterium]|nr:B12-binding domain-containing radical SAM protein [Pseudomonadota bacterium]MBU4296674.1 B12-binding domain-containing radical SAM protein [Pseudomonadota bacterium]MCG2748467.1 B12-binding domain-containing radical SAM protein [Desulfobulbaceae bacterium]